MLIKDVTQILDQLYARSYIPTMIIDYSGHIYFPKMDVDCITSKDFQFLLEKDDNSLHILNTYEMISASFPITIDEQEYLLLVGPCLILGCHSKNEYWLLDKTLRLSDHVSKESPQSFTDYTLALYTLFNQKSIDKKHIATKYLRIDLASHSQKVVFEEDLQDRRSQDATRDSYQFELRFIEYVKQGKREKLDWIFKKISDTYQVSLADNDLENFHLKFAAIVALLTRASIDCGVPLDTAFSLSDSLIQGLQHVHHMKNTMEYLKYASYEFCDVIEAHRSAHYSGPINQCIAYIDTHLYEKIRLQDLADICNLATAYISTRFKKEVGKSLSDFILDKKINEAKHLLLFTDYGYQEISTLLNFTSQSHFSLRFKQCTGQTPKSFRDVNFQYL